MSELTLIKYIRKNFPQHQSAIVQGIGDDAMVFKNGHVVSTDSFVEGIHFDFRYFTPYDLGYHCLGASLSDLAAVSAKPICALVALYLPKNTKDYEIKQLYRGFKCICQRYRCDISGGDIIESPFWGLTITVIGSTRKPLLRSGAKPGDFLYATNYLGLAETGRIALSRGYSKSSFRQSIKKHLYPEPRIDESLKLRRFAHSGIDTSDGLSTDAFHIAEESKVKIIIENIPIHPEVKLLLEKEKLSPYDFILSAGEDFELLITGKITKRIPGISLFKIGRILEGRGLYLSYGGALKKIHPTGYEHLKK
ncbi:MAG: thiamine-phosphate kinase [bacterium]